jgi:hypothetical protein
MQSDIKESMMLVAGGSLSEYDMLKKLSVSDFIIKYKIFIDSLIQE